MKDKSKNEVRAGMVIIISVVLFTMTVILAGNFGKILQKKRVVRVSFKSARGLVVNNPVHVSGVDVGLVKKITLESNQDAQGVDLDPRVLVVAEIPAEIYIAADSQAEVDVSLTGITVLKIDRGRSVKVLAEEEVIRGDDALNISELSSKVGGIASSVEEFITEIKSEAVVGDVKAILRNARGMTEKLDRVADNLDQFLGKNRETWQLVLQNLGTISTQTDKLLDDNRQNLTTTIAHLPEAAENIRKLTRDTQRLIHTNEKNITRAVAELEQTAKNLKETSRSVKRQPWILLRKPEKSDTRSRDLYTASRDLQSSAVEIRNSLETLNALEGVRSGRVALNQQEVDKLIIDLNSSLQSLNRLQKKLEDESVKTH